MPVTVTDLDDIELSDLTPRLRELAETIGLPAALRLVEARGGIDVYVPARPPAAHPLARIVGETELEALAALYPGDTIEVPKADGVYSKLRRRAVRAARRAGKTEAEVARQYGLTQRHVRRLCSDQADNPTGDMFAAADG